LESIRVSLLHQREVNIEGQSDIVQLLIRSLAGVVFVLILAIEYDVLAREEPATRIESGGAPFLVLALVIWFGGNIWDEVIGADRKSSLNRQFVLIAPCETAIFPVEILSAERCVSAGKCEAATHARIWLDKVGPNDKTVSGKYDVEFGGEHLKGTFALKYRTQDWICM
jgi:hypothetical protein